MIPLHVHSNYSMMCGTATVDDLLDTARGYGIKAMALTDTNGVYGLIQFAMKAPAYEIKPILGIYIDDPANSEDYALFLAKNNSGYSEICKLTTIRKLNDAFDLAGIIDRTSSNLFILTSSLNILRKIKKKKDVFAELISTENHKSKTRKLYEYAAGNGFKVVAVNPVYFLNTTDRQTHKVLKAIKENKNIENITDNELADPGFYFEDPDKLQKKWRTLPEAINNSELIADQCKVNLKFGEYKYPVYRVPEDEDSFSYLWKITHAGLNDIYDNVSDAELNRLHDELKVIKKLNFTDYFLIVWDIVREAKRRGMMTIGRGSAANSIVAYALGLTQVDPIRYNLYFERFLNEGRSNPPDVDIDFSWKERDEIVKYVFEKYGYENVAMISTHVTFRARSAFREVAKAFGFSNEEISKYSKYIPWTDARNLPDIAKMFPEAKALNFKLEPWKSIVEIASKIANFPRHLSIHPSGIVITPGPITNYTALEYAKNKGLGLIITQPDMYSIEDLGLVKIDLLSQRSLGVLRDTMNALNTQ